MEEWPGFELDTSDVDVDEGVCALGQGWADGDPHSPTHDKRWDLNRDRVRGGPNPYPGRPDGWIEEIAHDPRLGPSRAEGDPETKAVKSRMRFLMRGELHWALLWDSDTRRQALLCGQTTVGARSFWWSPDGTLAGRAAFLLRWRTGNGLINCWRCLRAVRLIREGNIAEMHRLRADFCSRGALPAPSAHRNKRPELAAGPGAAIAPLFGVPNALAADPGEDAGMRSDL